LESRRERPFEMKGTGGRLLCLDKSSRVGCADTNLRTNRCFVAIGVGGGGWINSGWFWFLLLLRLLEEEGYYLMQFVVDLLDCARHHGANRGADSSPSMTQ
jgi:hypothetical protein